MTTSDNHISFAELTDAIEHQRDNERLTNHLAQCSSCREEHGRLAAVIELMRSDTSQDAPRDVIEYAVNTFKARAEQPSLLRRLIGVVSFDSSHNAPAFGLRSGQATARQLVYTADEVDVYLRLAAEGENWVLSGQLLGADCSGGNIEISGGQNDSSTEVNDSCEFKLSPVPAGVYRMTIRLSDKEIEISELVLGA